MKITWKQITIGAAIVLLAVLFFQKLRANALAKAAPGTVTDSEKSYLGLPGLPRGVRNNNPGNLVFTQIPWNGKLWLNTDGKYEQFSTWIYGLRAMTKDIKNKITKGTNTLEKLAKKWTQGEPSSITENYLLFLQGEVGLPATEILKTDKDTLRKIVFAIVRKENGNGNEKWQLTEADFDSAYQMI